MRHQIKKWNNFDPISESSYDNKFIGKSDKSNWSDDDKNYLDDAKIEPFSDYEFRVIKEVHENLYPNRNDLIVEVKPHRLFSESIDQIEINIYIIKKGRKKPVLNSTTFITKLADEYFWLELKNELTHNSYNFKLDGLDGLIEVIKKL